MVRPKVGGNLAMPSARSGRRTSPDPELRAMSGEARPAASLARVLLAWGVHLFTATGGVAGFVALLALGTGRLREAALLMLLAFFIDAVDGSMARAVRASEVLPRIDGRRLDDMIDFLNYVVVPVAFLVAAGGFTHPAWGAVPILASAYGFSQVHAKTEDDFFLGFPSYWNVVAVYAWLFALEALWTTTLVVFLSVMVFVPLKYLYPSKMTFLGWTTTIAAAAWLGILTLVVADPERVAHLHLRELSLLFPAYYLALSLWLGGVERRSP